jgi:two-component system C4-dicarboxylate transport sensor histidine kinase DctB
MLLDSDGRVVAATDREQLGLQPPQPPQYFVERAALERHRLHHRSATRPGATSFTYSRKIELQGDLLGVIVVEVDLRNSNAAWAGISDAVMVTDSEGRSSCDRAALARPTEAEALAPRSPPARSNGRSGPPPTGPRCRRRPMFGRGGDAAGCRIDFQGWRMTTFTTYASVRERVNGVLALEIMGFAILLALAFYVILAAGHVAHRCSSSGNRRSCAQLNERCSGKSPSARRPKEPRRGRTDAAQSSKLAAWARCRRRSATS